MEIEGDTAKLDGWEQAALSSYQEFEYPVTYLNEEIPRWMHNFKVRIEIARQANDTTTVSLLERRMETIEDMACQILYSELDEYLP